MNINVGLCYAVTPQSTLYSFIHYVSKYVFFYDTDDSLMNIFLNDNDKENQLKMFHLNYIIN